MLMNHEQTRNVRTCTINTRRISIKSLTPCELLLSAVFLACRLDQYGAEHVIAIATHVTTELQEVTAWYMFPRRLGREHWTLNMST